VVRRQWKGEEAESWSEQRRSDGRLTAVGNQTDRTRCHRSASGHSLSSLASLTHGEVNWSFVELNCRVDEWGCGLVTR
jgi:hypothetical protein